jgi:DNA-binding NarL/FixJ family response regulator
MVQTSLRSVSFGLVGTTKGNKMTTTKQQIRILVSHSDPVAHAGLTTALSAYADFEVVDYRESEARIESDIIAADFERGLAALSTARDSGRSLKVLIVTTNDRECDIRRALKQGARGYVLQGCSLDELAGAVREAVAGGVHLGASIAQRLAESIYGDPLTAREEEVLGHVVEGLCNKEIARQLDLAVGTVKSHLRAVYAKLDVKSRTHAVAVARRRGLLQMRGSSLSDLGSNWVPHARTAERAVADNLA